MIRIACSSGVRPWTVRAVMELVLRETDQILKAMSAVQIHKNEHAFRAIGYINARSQVVMMLRTKVVTQEQVVQTLMLAAVRVAFPPTNLAST
jgi:hypothetical protein